MADPTFDLLLAIFILAAVFAWMPFRHHADLFTPSPAALLDDIPDLSDEDLSPRFTGNVA